MVSCAEFFQNYLRVSKIDANSPRAIWRLPERYSVVGLSMPRVVIL